MKKDGRKAFAAKKIRLILLLAFVFLMQHSDTVMASGEDYGCFFYGDYREMKLGGYDIRGGIYTEEFSIYNYSDAEQTVKVTSSNPGVVAVVSGTNNQKIAAQSSRSSQFSFRILKAGTSTITFTIGERSQSLPFFVFDDSIAIKNIVQTDYNTMKITWKKNEGYSGYYIMRSKGVGGLERIKTVQGGEKSSVYLDSTEWDRKYTYHVYGYIKNGSRSLVWGEKSPYPGISFRMEKKGSSIISVKKSGSSSVKIKWKKQAEATGYKLYRSTSEHGKYKCIYTANSAGKTSYTQKVKKGVTYYYKVKTFYPNLVSDDSEVISKMLPKSASTVRKSIRLSGDRQYYYVASGKFHVVEPGKNCFYIYTLNSSLKKVSRKTVKLKYDSWGGCYQGPDDSFYVAVGYNNLKESRTKTVIKVIKYSKSWKKGKTCNIKGNAANVFEGIYLPFEGGNCRMDIQGNTLYLHTARIMFALSGVHHQSNISFAINTKTMKEKKTAKPYVSHSFNQFVKFDNGNLYLLDHGDGYPRSVALSVFKDYGSENAKNMNVDLFRLRGQTGDNFTGCVVGGMEIGAGNVVVCGKAQPHYSRVKGVTGSKYGYAYNVYVLIADKETGKHRLKWLTTYHPKTTKAQVGVPCMVKLDDNRFAIMYNVTQGRKTKLCYVVINEKGQKIYSRTYSNMTLSGDAQPIVYNGRVVWIDRGYLWIDNIWERTTKVYAVPALLK